MLAAQGADLDAKCHGIPPLHLCIASAVQPGALSFASSSVAVLLENGVSVTAKVRTESVEGVCRNAVSR